MPARTTLLLPCTYLKMSGDLCGRGCYRGICWEHTGRAPNFPCHGCGRGTRAASGYCTSDGCASFQHRAYRHAKTAVKKVAAVPARSRYWTERQAAAEPDLDKLVDDLFTEL